MIEETQTLPLKQVTRRPQIPERLTQAVHDAFIEEGLCSVSFVGALENIPGYPGGTELFAPGMPVLGSDWAGKAWSQIDRSSSICAHGLLFRLWCPGKPDAKRLLMELPAFFSNRAVKLRGDWYDLPPDVDLLKLQIDLMDFAASRGLQVLDDEGRLAETARLDERCGMSKAGGRAMMDVARPPFSQPKKRTLGKAAMPDIDDIDWLAGADAKARLIHRRVRRMLRSKIGRSFRREQRISAFELTDKPKIGVWQASNRLYRQIIKRLRKKQRLSGLTVAEAKVLNALRSCKRMTPCTSAACPKCTYALQEAMAKLHAELRSYGITLDGCLTIIASQMIAEPGTGPNTARRVSSATDQIQAFTGELSAAFDEAGVTMVMGGIDLEWQEFRDGICEAHGRPHLHALVSRNQVNAGRRHLNAAFPTAPTVYRPVQLDAYDGDDKWVRYCLKYPNQRKIRKRGDRGEWLDPDDKKPRVEQQIHQAVVMHEAGWGGRLFLRGVELTPGLRGWQLTLVDFKPETPPRRRR